MDNEIDYKKSYEQMVEQEKFQRKTIEHKESLNLALLLENKMLRISLREAHEIERVQVA